MYFSCKNSEEISSYPRTTAAVLSEVNDKLLESPEM